MKVVIDIPEIPTNDHQRWALSNGTPYAHGKWKNGRCTNCGAECFEDAYMRDIKTEFCHRCGADMRKRGEAE